MSDILVAAGAYARFVPRTRVDELGRLVEIPPVTLDCGHPYGPGLITVGMSPTEEGGRARSYYCRTCRAVTLDR